jgi:integrase
MDKEAMNVASVKQPTEKQSRRGGSRDGLFQRSGWWWLDYYDAEGKRHRKKAAPDYTTAKLIYRQTMTAIARGEVLGVREEGLRLKEFVERIWWPRTKLRLAPAWAERVKTWCLDRVVLPRFGAFKLSGLRKDTIEAWVTERIGSVSASTFNKELWTVKNICKCAVDWGYMKASPAQSVKRMKEPNGRVRYLTAEERETLIREANATLRLYIVAALQTGARRSELIRLRWKDVDFKTRTVRFANTKNGDSRSVPMTDTLGALIQGFARPLDPEAPVFPEREPLVLTRAFTRLIQRLGFKDLTFHDLRHDAASTLAMAGVPLRTVAEILGHRDMRMTTRYSHLSPQHLREAIKALDTLVGDSKMAGSDSIGTI